MNKFPIGIIANCFRIDMPTALKKCAALGAQGVQIHGRKGEVNPDTLIGEQRNEFKKLVADNGLVISALCGDLGGGGFIHPEKNPDKIEISKKIIALAKDLGTNIVTTHIGVVPADPNHDRYKIMQEACYELATFAESYDACFAVETGPETAVILKRFLDDIGSKGIGVNLDPANLVMVAADDPAQAVYTLKDYIVHTHAKDGKQLFYLDPEIVYDVVKTDLVTEDSFIEVPLGEGSVNWEAYLNALTDIGYNGFLTIEREVGHNPEADVKKAVDFLKGQMGC